jgi:glycosyltransferase involved in cell wall biosynthesis
LRLSVVMPNFNDGHNFHELIPKIYSYLSIDDEIIFIDDGSTDGSYERIAALVEERKLERVKLFRNASNIGVAETENRGAGIATGQYLYFAASDDDVSPEFFEKCISALNQHIMAGACSTGSYLEYPNKLRIKLPLKYPSKKIKFITPLECKEKLLKNENWISGNCCIYRRNQFIAEGGFKSELEGFCDILFTLLIPMKYGVVFIPEVLTNFRLSEQSYAAKHYRLENLGSTMKIIDKIKNVLLEECGSKLSKIWWQRISIQIFVSTSIKEKIKVSHSIPQLKELVLIMFNIFYKYKFNMIFYTYLQKIIIIRLKLLIAFIYKNKLNRGEKW